MKKALLFFCFCGMLCGDERKLTEPLPTGNFSVPIVSQIGPLISFGQLLIGKNALLVELLGAYARGHHSYSHAIAPNVVYGIRDDLSLFLFVPFNIKSRTDSSSSSGIQDIFLQLEYGFYNRTCRDYTLQATIVGNVQFPTGSHRKYPQNGDGSFVYFLGPTFAYTSQNWYAFVSSGVNFCATHHGTRMGNSYLYQWGFARYLKPLSPPGWIFDLMVEFDGTYVEKDKNHHGHDHDSGGNILLMTPSIWLSSQRWIIQWGVGFPIVQNLHGHQSKISIFTAYTLGAAFQF